MSKQLNIDHKTSSHKQNSCSDEIFGALQSGPPPKQFAKPKAFTLKEKIDFDDQD